MRIRNVVLSMLLCATAFGAGKKLPPETIPSALKEETPQAAKEEIPQASPSRIAVVSIRRIFENCRKNTQRQEEMEAERKKIVAELERILSEANAFRADMETRKPGSTDYVNLMREAMEKEALLDAKEKFYQQDLTSREQRWREQLYLEVIATVGNVAKQKGLDLVLAKEENQFPAANPNELLLTIKTNKVLFHTDQMDITNEVLAAMDKAN
jgi:Skp family chaperone for outer membrane proteins